MIATEGWAWGQLDRDGYVGWLPISRWPLHAPRRRTRSPLTFAFPGASIKLPPFETLLMGARSLCERRHLRGHREGWYLPTRHLGRPLPRNGFCRGGGALRRHTLFVGRQDQSWNGLLRPRADLIIRGVPAARETATCSSTSWDGRATQSNRTAATRDLIFWKGHVAIARDATIVHANAHHMATVIGTAPPTPSPASRPPAAIATIKGEASVATAAAAVSLRNAAANSARV